MLTASDRLTGLLQGLTVEERAMLTAGADAWHLPALASAGIGRLKMSDGPSGVRGESFGIHRSLSYPCGIAVGSTWDVELVGRYGAALAEEARLKAVHVLLGPTICIPRVALAGRTFESFSEDPLLTSRLAVAYIRGVQGGGVACCVKHFACNDQEHERMSISAEVDERTLREIHLPAFEAAVREANVWAVMSAYNRVNGVYCGEHEWLLTTLLKDQWGFDGVVISDWGGTHSTVDAANAGLDIEMPGPAKHLGPHLATGVATGDVEGAVLDDHCDRVLRLAERTGLLDSPTPSSEREEDDPQRRALARELAISGTVLLRNRSMLPLDPSLQRLAVIGPNAGFLVDGGGGSSQVAALRHTSFLDELTSRLPGVVVEHEPGCRIDRGQHPLDAGLIPDGLSIEFHEGRDLAGSPVHDDRLRTGLFLQFGAVDGVAAGQGFSVRARGRFVPTDTGAWEVSLAGTGATKLYLDGRELLVHRVAPGESFLEASRNTATARLDLVAGAEHDLEVRFVSDAPTVHGFRLGARRAEEPGGIDRAVELARGCDAALVVVGANTDLESEGFDRPSLALAGEQDELIRRVLEVNRRTVIVVNAGAPVAMPWADDAAAVLMLWYPGEEGAPALADVLTGAAEPGGRLPITFPRRIEDVAAWRTYPGVDGKTEYREGVFVGYRQFDTDGTDPAFSFGHGLGYTTFEYGAPRVETAGDGTVVAITVTNTGARRGSEVVQLYVGGGPAPLPRPDQELRAFTKVTLDAGEAREVRLHLDRRAFSYWDPRESDWVCAPGSYELRIGSSSRDVRQRCELRYGVIT